MGSPQTVKRLMPEIVTLEPVIFFKADSIKENIPPAPSMENHTNLNRLLIDKQCQATPKKRVPTEDPVTPNANFKLLTSLAAALDYANCGTPKAKHEKSDLNEGLVLFDNRTCEDSEVIFNPPSRKEKSLAIICTRFLDMYPLYPDMSKGTIVVSLDEVSVKLGIERRRLYDIVNVFESIEMLSKLAKNRYMWYGKNYLTEALQKLKSGAIKECILEKLQYVLEFEGNLPESKQSCILDEVRDFNQSFEHRQSSSKTPEILRHPSPIPELRKEKSLAIMSQKFLMLFLVSPTKIISLGVAAKVLNGFQNSEKGAQVKTQIRRLYDIANVLSSIGLIQKEVTIAQNGRKPAFKYIGPDLDSKTETPSKESQKQKANSEPRLPKLKPKSLVRHSSFQEICAVAEIERNKIFLDDLPNSAPPFQKSFQNSDKTPDKTSFSDLKLNLNSKTKEVPPSSDNISSQLRDLKNLPLLQKSKSETLGTEKKKPQAPLRSISLPRQSSVKLINVPKQILAANGPYYILNPSTKEVVQSPTPMGTVLLISPLSVNNPAKEVVLDKVPEKKVSRSRTLQLSTEQRDTILKSLNLSLSDGQIAAIQLEGSSMSPSSDIKPQCNLLKIIEKHEQNTTSVNGEHNNSVPIKQIITLHTESTESSRCSTRNASPNGSSPRFGSPLSLASSVTTSLTSKEINTDSCNSNSLIMEASQIVNGKNDGSSNSILKTFLLEEKTMLSPSVSPNNSFVTNKGVLRKIGNQVDVPELPFKSGFAQNLQAGTKHCKTYQNISIQHLTKGEKRKSEDISVNSKSSLPLKEINNLSATTNSCSSDSLNMEVSEILNGKSARGSNSQFKSFLIDEKTILSPIKKHKGMVLSKPLTPTYFTTPPYTAHDAYFEFNNLPLSNQINGKGSSFPLLQKTNNATNNKLDFKEA